MSIQSSFSSWPEAGPALPVPDAGRPWPVFPSVKPDSWPEGMQAIADLIIAAHVPMVIAWGPELRLFYNDAYAELLGDKHPNAMGQPLPLVRRELWPQLQPLVMAALGGQPVHFDNALMYPARNGQVERYYVSASITPVRHDGNVIGVYFVLSDTTSRVLAEQRHAFHLKLSESLRLLVDTAGIMEAASSLAGDYLGVARVGYGEIDAAAGTIRVDRDWTDGSIASLAGQSRPLESFGPAIVSQLRKGRTLRLDDIALDERAAPYAQGYASIGARAMVIVPLIEDGHLAAVFYLHEQFPRRWTDQEIALAEDVARHTREVVRRARVEESLRDEKRVLEMLNRTGQALVSTLDLETLLQAITDAGTELAGARFGGFFYNAQDQQGERLHLYTLSGVSRDEFEQFSRSRPAGIFRPSFDGEGPVRCSDISRDPRHVAQGAPAGQLSVRSYLAVPVVSRSGAVLGGLLFGHPEPGVFTERTERIIAGVAAQAAIAMDNARLYEVAQKSALERDALLQSERAARVQAERLSHTKDEFLAMLAHELRNPLAPISSSASLLSMQFKEEPRIRQTATIISRQVRHMSRLIDDLLDVSRVTRGLVKLKLGVVDFRDIVSGALDQARPLIAEKGHQVEVALPSTPVHVRGDQTRLVQSVANILNNAAKYTQKDGRIALGLEARDGRMLLTVSDNGSGMPAELVPNVFDLFTQGARTLARSQGGLGLGLTLVKRLVELHEGEVAAHSEGVGKGSRFTLTLPCVDAAPDIPGASLGPQEAAEGTPLARPLRLVLVDDNADAADSLSTLLTVQGYHTAVEYDARSGLRRARAERPDAMLVDIGLPDIDGYQLARQLRAMPETSGTVLVAITGYGQAKDRERAIAAGFAHHLVKPVDMTALVRVLESVGATAARLEAPVGTA